MSNFNGTIFVQKLSLTWTNFALRPTLAPKKAADFNKKNADWNFDGATLTVCDHRIVNCDLLLHIKV